jgi:hypothetical protein
MYFSKKEKHDIKSSWELSDPSTQSLKKMNIKCRVRFFNITHCYIYISCFIPISVFVDITKYLSELRRTDSAWYKHENQSSWRRICRTQIIPVRKL